MEFSVTSTVLGIMLDFASAFAVRADAEFKVLLLRIGACKRAM
jgi:hypothetical protein